MKGFWVMPSPLDAWNQLVGQEWIFGWQQLSRAQCCIPDLESPSTLPLPPAQAHPGVMAQPKALLAVSALSSSTHVTCCAFGEWHCLGGVISPHS